MEAREAWRALLGLIEHILQESQRPAGAKLFRSLGPRRLGRAQRQLHRERENLLQIARQWGLSIEPGDSSQSGARDDNLSQGYVALAHAYRHAARIAEQCQDAQSMRWLLGRADMHDEHSRFISR